MVTLVMTMTSMLLLMALPLLPLVRLLKLTAAAGLIHDAGRGWYSSLAQEFKLDTKPVASLVRLLEKKFPLREFTCWSTEQVRAQGHHLLARLVSFMHVERDAIPSVAEFLKDAGFDVHANWKRCWRASITNRRSSRSKGRFWSPCPLLGASWVAS